MYPCNCDIIHLLTPTILIFTTEIVTFTSKIVVFTCGCLSRSLSTRSCCRISCLAWQETIQEIYTFYIVPNVVVVGVVISSCFNNKFSYHIYLL